jgi:hypothetical protein
VTASAWTLQTEVARLFGVARPSWGVWFKPKKSELYLPTEEFKLPLKLETMKLKLTSAKLTICQLKK